MIAYNLYRASLRLPRVLGHARITSALRRYMSPPETVVQHGFRMYLDPLEWAQVDILTNGVLEPQTSELFRRILRAGDTVIDVGAHVGYHSLLAAQIVGANGRVIAVEPQPYNCARILSNAALNKFTNIVTVIGAVGARDNNAILRDQVATDKSRLTLNGPGISDGLAAFDVPLLRLDTIAERHHVHDIRLLKIDVEGYELEVLKGAAAILPRVENVVFEALENLPTSTAAEITNLLQEAGFTLTDIGGAAPWRQGMPLAEGNVWAKRPHQTAPTA